jgi:hypothetical protein
MADTFRQQMTGFGNRITFVPLPHEHDYQAMLSAVRQGRIKVYTEN